MNGGNCSTHGWHHPFFALIISNDVVPSVGCKCIYFGKSCWDDLDDGTSAEDSTDSV